MTRPLIKEIVNLNGTSRDSLVNQRIEARQALASALDALIETSPHPRDFPDSVPGAAVSYQQARKIYQDRLTSIHALMEDLQAEAEALSEQP
jgi:hypothetical protein